MPTYQYACTECSHRFEAVQTFHEDSLTHCPTCDGRVRKVFNAVGVVFKGSGFYRTDSRASAESVSSESGKSASEKSESATAESSSKSESGSSKSESGSSKSESGSSKSDSGSSKSESTKSDASKSTSAATPSS